MSDIRVFGPDDEGNDYSTMGLVGTLIPISCTFHEVANGESSIELEHPIDPYGKYTALERQNILVVPVPVRTTPEIQNGSCVTAVSVYKVKPLNQLSSTAQRTLYKKETGSSKMKVMAPGDTVTVVFQPYDWADVDRWKVVCKYGTGWVYPAGLELVDEVTIPDNSQAIEEVQSPWTVMDQYFRIYKVTKNLDSVTAYARHITYDLLYDVSHFYYQGNQTLPLQEAADTVLEFSYGGETRFKAYTNVTNEAVPGTSLRGKTMIAAFLDPEEGLCAKYHVNLVRNNHDLYLLHDPGLNRGVRIQYSKNMLGVEFESDEDSVITRIIPVGEQENGDGLYLGGDPLINQFVDSDRIDDYPVKHVYYMKCENCRVGQEEEDGTKLTTEVAQARMIAQAEEMFENGCDLPKISMKVDFVNIGDTEEYRQFANLENCFLYDYVIVQHPDIGIDITARISEIEWDCLLDRMTSMTIGEVGETLANSGITSWQIPSGINGNKITQGTISGGALQADIINTKHIQSGSINTDALQAQSVTAEKLAAGSVTADKIQAGSVTADKIDTASLNAAVADIVTLLVGNITADNIETDELAAVLGNFVKIYADYAGIDFATVKDLITDELIFRVGSANELYIDRLVATSAFLASATLGDLVIKGEDGNYYRIYVQSDGTLITEQIEVTDDEIEAGETDDGKGIVDTDVDIPEMNGGNILGTSAVINTILTDALTANKITAAQAMIASATIPELAVTAINAIGNSIDITANTTIQMLIATDELIKAWYTFGADGLDIGKAGSTYSTRIDDTGFHILQLNEKIGSFAKRRLITEAVQLGPVDAVGTRVVMRNAYDGGVIFVPEEVGY